MYVPMTYKYVGREAYLRTYKYTARKNRRGVAAAEIKSFFTIKQT